ncbi:MAG: response regulator [Pseudomonadota bacterium]
MAGEKVLLVDDEEDFVEALVARMEARGLSTTVATNGPKALEKARQQDFHVVILDLAMPGMDGIETLRQLKAENPNVQVVLLTGHATLEKGIQAMKLGAMDFIEKPVDIKVLLEKIREAKSKSDAATEQETNQIIQDIVKTKGW